MIHIFSPIEAFKSPKKGGLSVYGTNVLMNVTNSIGALGVRNSQLTSFGERAESLSGEYVEENILAGNPTCHACPVACKKEVEIKDEWFRLNRVFVPSAEVRFSSYNTNRI